MEIIGYVIALVGVVLAVPTTIHALRELGWITTLAPIDEAKESESPYSEMLVSGEEERKLLALSPSRADTPGTIEYDLVKFENRLPKGDRSKDPLKELNGLIRNPELIRFSGPLQKKLRAKFYVGLCSLCRYRYNNFTVHRRFFVQYRIGSFSRLYTSCLWRRGVR